MKPSSLLIAAALALPSALSPAYASPVQEEKPAEKKMMAGPEITHSSSLWNKAEEEVSGGWSIVHTPKTKTTPEKTEFVLGSDFDTKKGPDLKVVLSPRKADEVKAKNALQGSLILGPLNSSKGEARFVIPNGTDLSKYHSVAIHCEKYTVLWGTSPLESGEVLAHGSSWTKQESKITGHWEIAKVGSDHVLRLGDDFDTKRAPDLKIVLTPAKVKAANDRNALEGARIIGPLKEHKGAQTYDLGEDFKLKDFASLLIHCKEYSKLWGGADLR